MINGHSRRLQNSETGGALFARNHLDIFTIGDIDVGRPTAITFRINDPKRIGRAWYIQSVKLEVYRRVLNDAEKLEKHSANYSVRFFADSWYGKKELEWSIYPVGR